MSTEWLKLSTKRQAAAILCVLLDSGLERDEQSQNLETYIEDIKTAERRKAMESPEVKALVDAAEMLWVVLANVSGGDWEKQTNDWVIAAERWRDNYFKALTAYRSRGTREGSEEPKK